MCVLQCVAACCSPHCQSLFGETLIFGGGSERQRDSLICETWLIHMWDMTHSYVRHDSFVCETWLIHMCDMTHSYVTHDSSRYVTWLLYSQNNALLSPLSSHIPCLRKPPVCGNPLFSENWKLLFSMTFSFSESSWLIQMCDMTHSMWHDSFMCDMTHSMRHDYSIVR